MIAIASWTSNYLITAIVYYIHKVLGGNSAVNTLHTTLQVIRRYQYDDATKYLVV